MVLINRKRLVGDRKATALRIPMLLLNERSLEAIALATSLRLNAPQPGLQP